MHHLYPAPLRNFTPAAALLMLAGCIDLGPEMGATPTEQGTSLATPAAAYCHSIGGRSEVRDENGTLVGYCHLADGRVVDEWDLFRAHHKPRRDAN